MFSQVIVVKKDKSHPYTTYNTFNGKFPLLCNFRFKEFEIFLSKKRRFRLCRDSCPGLSIAGRLLWLTELHKRPTSPSSQEEPGLESRHSRKRLFFHRKISNFLNLNLFAVLQYKSLTLSTRTPVGNVSYLICD